MARMTNPFTPAFGGKPQHFFGREEELALIGRAIRDDNSPHRALFITGNRGCGKTALLERMSQLAAAERWLTVDVRSAHASSAIVRQLAGADVKTEERVAEPSALGVSPGHVGVSSTLMSDAGALPDVLLERCRSLTVHNGVFITVDEIQKIPASDMENLCDAVQMSLRKGLPVMLALAGLPGSKKKVSAYDGCTFMQRAEDVRLGEPSRRRDL